MVDRDSPEVSMVAAAPSALGAGRHGLETHTPFRMTVRPASSFSSPGLDAQRAEVYDDVAQVRGSELSLAA